MKFKIVIELDMAEHHCRECPYYDEEYNTCWLQDKHSGYSASYEHMIKTCPLERVEDSEFKIEISEDWDKCVCEKCKHDGGQTYHDSDCEYCKYNYDHQDYFEEDK